MSSPLLSLRFVAAQPIGIKLEAPASPVSCVRVSSVTAGSQAAIAGVVAGDELVEIAGASLAGLAPVAVLGRLKSALAAAPSLECTFRKASASVISSLVGSPGSASSPTAQTLIVPITCTPLGLSLREHGGNIVVEAVTAGSESHAAGITAGDSLVACAHESLPSGATLTGLGALQARGVISGAIKAGVNASRPLVLHVKREGGAGAAASFAAASASPSSTLLFKHGATAFTPSAVPPETIADGDLHSRLVLGRQRVCDLVKRVHTALDDVRANAAAAHDAVSAAVVIAGSEHFARNAERLLCDLNTCEARKLSHLEAEAESADAVLAQIDALLVDDTCVDPPDLTTISLLERVFHSELLVVELPFLDVVLDAHESSSSIGRVRTHRVPGPDDIELDLPCVLPVHGPWAFRISLRQSDDYDFGSAAVLAALLRRFRVIVVAASKALPTSGHALDPVLTVKDTSIIVAVEVPEMPPLQSCCAQSDASVSVTIGVVKDTWSVGMPEEALVRTVRFVCHHERKHDTTDVEPDSVKLGKGKKQPKKQRTMIPQGTSTPAMVR